jgi:outer membrane protein assembly factor BamB
MKSLLYSLLLCLTAVRLPAETFKLDNQRLGYSRASVTPPLKLDWKFKAGKFYSSPAVADGVVYIGNEDRNLYAVSLEDGKEKWHRHMGERIYASSPTVAMGKALICSVDGCLDAADVSDGKLAWKFCVPFSAMERRMMSAPAAFSSPLAEGGLAYFGADDKMVYAVNLSSGEVAWKTKIGGKVHDNSPALDQGKLFIGAHDGVLYALDAVKGDLLWKVSSKQALNTCPVAWKDKVYVASGEKPVPGFPLHKVGYLWAFDEKDGKEVWKFKTGFGNMSSPAIDAEGRLVFGSADKKVYCLKADSGEKLWEFATNGYVVASPLICGNVVYIGSWDKKFYALDMESGKELWHYDTGGAIFSSATVAGDRIVVGGLDGNLYCFAADGRIGKNSADQKVQKK